MISKRAARCLKLTVLNGICTLSLDREGQRWRGWINQLRQRSTINDKRQTTTTVLLFGRELHSPTDWVTLNIPTPAPQRPTLTPFLPPSPSSSDDRYSLSLSIALSLSHYSYVDMYVCRYAANWNCNTWCDEYDIMNQMWSSLKPLERTRRINIQTLVEKFDN